MNALNISAFQSPSTKHELAAQFAAKKAELDTLQAELDIMKASLIDESEQPWLAANEAKPTSSVDLGKAKITYTQRKKLVAIIPDGADDLFDATFDLAIDGSSLPIGDRQDVLDALSTLGIPQEAIKLSAGFRAKKEALTMALGSGDASLVAFVRENGGFTPSVRVNKPKKGGK